MTTRPWFPFYPGDYDRDTRDLDHEQHGVYFLLLMRTWDRETCSLPNDMDFIRRCLPKIHGLTFNRLVPPILERFFHLNEAGQWENKRMKKERRKTEELTKKQRRIAEKRWKNNSGDHATAMPSQSQSHSVAKATGARAPGDPLKAELYARGKQLLGPSAGGQVTRLLHLKGSVPGARAILEMAACAGSPAEYVGAVLRGRLPSAEQDQDVLLLAWCRKNGVSGCDALEIPAILEDMNGGQPYRRKANGNHT